jgi:hypothetical protein
MQKVQVQHSEGNLSLAVNMAQREECDDHAKMTAASITHFVRVCVSFPWQLATPPHELIRQPALDHPSSAQSGSQPSQPAPSHRAMFFLFIRFIRKRLKALRLRRDSKKNS